MMHDYTLSTERLSFRQVELHDLFTIMTWRNNDEIRKWFFNKNKITEVQQLTWYENYLKNDNEMMFFLEMKDKMCTPVGTIALVNIDHQNSEAEIGRIMIGNFDVRGKGIGVECLETISHFGFEKLNLKCIYAYVLKNNISSLKIFNKTSYAITDAIRSENNEEYYKLERKK